jgi:transcriptional regulator with XRE-family HTH domain
VTASGDRSPARGETRRARAVDVAVARRVRERRVMLGLTQQQLAEPLGITLQQLGKYERGADRLSAGRLHLIAQALGTDVGYFFVGVDPAGRGRAEPTGARARRQMLLRLVRDVAGIGDPKVQEAVCELVRVLAVPGAGTRDEPQVEQLQPPSAPQSSPVR